MRTTPSAAAATIGMRRMTSSNGESAKACEAAKTRTSDNVFTIPSILDWERQAVRIRQPLKDRDSFCNLAAKACLRDAQLPTHDSNRHGDAFGDLFGRHASEETHLDQAGLGFARRAIFSAGQSRFARFFGISMDSMRHL